MNTENFDAIIIGGGPAGSTAATLIAKDGHKVLLLERERFPRYHVGESLLPSTVHFITELLGCRQEVLDANFMVKYGGIYRWGNSPEPWFFEFKEKYHKANYAFQVERSKFDQILLENSKRKGVDVREEHRVTDIITDDNGRITGVHYQNAKKENHTALAPYVLDGSGQAGLLAKRIGERNYDDYFKHIALYGYFENGKRYSEPKKKGAVLSVAFDHGWIWYIPVTDTLTSVGIVVHRDQASKIRELGTEKAMSTYIESCPMIKEFLESAHRVTEGDYGKIRMIKDYSYHHEKFSAPGCALIGDSACFVDPVLASGVHLATYGALQAARAVNTCLRNGTTDGGISEQKAFEEFEQRYRREFALFYRYLAVFYEMHHDKESYFWQAHKMLEDDSSATSPDARDSFIQLAAGLASSGEPLFQSGDAFVDSLRSSVKATNHRITDAKGDELSEKELELIEESRSQVFREQNELWEFSADSDKETNPKELGKSTTAIFSGGLVPTADSLAWQMASNSPA
jgi:halogenation protein CepH